MFSSRTKKVLMLKSIVVCFTTPVHIWYVQPISYIRGSHLYATKYYCDCIITTTLNYFQLRNMFQ